MIFSLQRRFLLLLLLPVALILVLVGVAGFFYAREYLLQQWRDIARLELEKTAHVINMKLDEKLELINLIAKSENIPDHYITQAYLIQQLAQKEGVLFVDIEDGTPPAEVSLQGSSTDAQAKSDLVEGLYVMEVCEEFGFCAPTTDPYALDRTLRIIKPIGDENTGATKKLLVRINFDSFMEPIRKMVHAEGSSACLVTSTGQLLAHTDKAMSSRRMLGETGDPVEKQVLKEIRKKAFGTVFGQGHPPDVVAGFYKIPAVNWYIILYLKGSEVLRPIIEFRFYYAVAGMVALLVILILIRETTGSVGSSIADISTAAAKISTGDYTGKLLEDRSDEIGELKRNFNIMMEGLERRDLIEQTFGRYVDKKIAEELMNKPEALRLGGEKRTVTIMMSDLRDFTSKTEKLQPEQVIKMLNRYFSRMIAVIERYRGIIVDFYGDSILVFFNGAETGQESRALAAVNCALEMQREMQGFQGENTARGLPELSMGIGIHTGDVIVGNIGTESRAKYGIVGAPVNMTDRIQAVAGYGRVVISEATYNTISACVNVSDGFVVCLKGVEEDQKLYEVESVAPECVEVASG
jgi:adenylate cyclase